MIKTAKLVAATSIVAGICNQNTIDNLPLLAYENVSNLPHNGYHIHKDAAAMGSPLGPFLANIFRSQFSAPVANCANGTIDEHHVGDNILIFNPSKLDDVVTTGTKKYKNPKFTSEFETDCGISFFGLRVVKERMSNLVFHRFFLT